ncbi:archaetidylserine decarboxylase [Pseudobacteriovorax antillogorgiicola]|uniref:phosphatidylserine decarboxylase n=1 Tax=Pseudobacteriovorax antillogorgiicola TaxID=1513793 RepID=A0A1Y6B3W7_9BACT|nr:archaetidylserine decarboxylase [Pseudobacteriovorax antillogorgiicola]TCS59226.1 phosphatidylserine decarboxylase [Pseudobacteriovorax antillogorgiicola]SME90358.1 phosphatidylserine decarboxylase [Pseudobacteriovorax antillogorgiicola]
MAKNHPLEKLVPLNLLSFLLGVMVRVKWPKPISWLVNSLFVTVFRIDMEEAERPMVEYTSIEDIFTRGLKPGARPIDGLFISPADGVLSQRGGAQEGRAVQAKGLDYELIDLVFEGQVVRQGSLVSFATVYLAPHNYHRVHAPVSGAIKKIRYIPGQLWPVNEPFVKFMPKLFNRNERLVFDIQLPGGGYVYAVMVGALNVGRISSPHLPDFVTNDWFKNSGKGFENDLNIDIKAGDELGTFMLGSTVVLVLDELAANEFELSDLSQKKPIRMGENLLNA